ncbi:MAG TPA: DUF4836 family protein [Bacteroidales bacterium]|nr:DUF4836 family protein [Bacteroidales bacterium]
MKRKITLIALLSAALLIGVTSCSKKTANLNFVPKNAFVVMTVDGKSWKDMVKPEKMLENDQYKEGMKEIEQTSKKLAEFIEKVAKDPNELGIEADGMMYGFVSMEDENLLLGFIAGVDKKKFEENLKMISEELDFELETKEKDGITYFMPEDELILGWDKNKVMLLGLADGHDFDIEKELFALMNQKKSESILDDKDFNAFLKDSKDFNIWISSNIVNVVDDNEEIAELEKMLGIDFNDNYGHIFFEYTKGESTMTAKLRFNESIQKADWNKVFKNLTEKGMLDGIFSEFGGFGGSAAEADVKLMFMVMDDYTMAAREAIADKVISQEEADQLNTLMEELNDYSDEFEVKYKDDAKAAKLFEELSKEPEYEKILTELMQVSFELYGCKGSELLEMGE